MDTNKKWVATLCMVIVGITSICFLLGETPACTVYTGGLVAVCKNHRRDPLERTKQVKIAHVGGVYLN